MTAEARIEIASPPEGLSPMFRGRVLVKRSRGLETGEVRKGQIREHIFNQELRLDMERERESGDEHDSKV